MAEAADDHRRRETRELQENGRKGAFILFL
jgi:hypothetical protein